MIERMQVGNDINLEQNDNSVFEKNGKWYVALDDGTQFTVNTRLGKTLSLSLRIFNAVVNSWDTSTNDFARQATKKRLQYFDCFALVAIGLGLLKVDPKLLSDSSYTANKEFFPDDEFVKIHDTESFDNLVRTILKEEHVGVVQVQDDSQVLVHTMFVFRGNKKIYLAEKAGHMGAPFFSSSDDLVPSILEDYGSHCAVGTYDELANREDLRKHYEEGHYQ